MYYYASKKLEFLANIDSEHYSKYSDKVMEGPASEIHVHGTTGIFALIIAQMP